MSLINDALKRATQAQTPPAPTTEPAPAMQAVDRQASARLPAYFLPVLLFIVSGACFFIVKGWNSASPGAPAHPVAIQAREVAPIDPVPAAAAAAAQEIPQEIPVNRQFALNDGPSPSAAGAENMDKPAFRLQGIFYRVKNPSAMVNSKTVYVGDTIDGSKVDAITRDSISLTVDGQTKVLTLY